MVRKSEESTNLIDLKCLVEIEYSISVGETPTAEPIELKSKPQFRFALIGCKEVSGAKKKIEDPSQTFILSPSRWPFNSNKFS